MLKNNPEILRVSSGQCTLQQHVGHNALKSSIMKALTLSVATSVCLSGLLLIATFPHFTGPSVHKLSDMMIVFGGWDDFKRARASGTWLSECERRLQNREKARGKKRPEISTKCLMKQWQEAWTGD